MNNLRRFRNIAQHLSKRINEASEDKNTVTKFSENIIQKITNSSKRSLQSQTFLQQKFLSLHQINNVKSKYASSNPVAIISLAVCSFFVINFMADYRVANAQVEEQHDNSVYESTMLENKFDQQKPLQQDNIEQSKQQVSREQQSNSSVSPPHTTLQEQQKKDQKQQQKQQQKEQETSQLSSVEQLQIPQKKEIRRNNSKIEQIVDQIYIMMSGLTENSALITNQCPLQIRKYLQKCGITIVSLHQHLNQSLELEALDNLPCLILKNKRNQYHQYCVGDLLSQPNVISRKKQAFNILELQKNSSKFCSERAVQYLSNFLHPPYQLNSYEQYMQMVETLHSDNQYLIIAYVPSIVGMHKELKKKQKIDNTDFRQLQDQFCMEKYTTATNQANYCIVRDEQLAQKMKLNTHNVHRHNYIQIVYPTTSKSGMETSVIIKDKIYSIRRISLASLNKSEHMNQKMGIKRQLSINTRSEQAGKCYKRINVQSNPTNSLDYYTNIYVNEINIEQQMHNFVWKHRVNGDHRKILLICTKQNNKKFQAMLHKTMIKVAKISQSQILVLYTQNQKLLTKFFQIVPDPFVTIRLLDLNKQQTPTVYFPESYGDSQERQSFYSRRKFYGGFTVENLCKFIKNFSKNQQYTQHKDNLSRIGSIITFDIQKQGLDSSIVLHQKQGCRGCHLTHKYLEQLQQIIQMLNGQDQAKKQQIIIKYAIEHPSLLQNMSITRLNILNEELNSQTKNDSNHDLTPQLSHIWYDINSKLKRTDIDIGKILSRVDRIANNQKDEQNIHKQIVIDLIEAILQTKIQSITNLNEGDADHSQLI